MPAPDEVRGLYDELAKRAEARDWSCDIAEAVSALLTRSASLLACPLVVESVEKCDGSVASITRNGDVVAGLYLGDDAPAACDATLTVGGVTVRGGPLALRPGKLTSFFGDSGGFFPILAIAYSEIHVFGNPDLLKHVSVVFGLLSQPAARRCVALDAHELPGGAFVRDGYFGYN